MSRECACTYYDNGKCRKSQEAKSYLWCVEIGCSDKTPSNGDRLRAMNDEELADFLGDWADRHLAWMCDSQGECLAWLKEPAKEEHR